MNDFHSRRNFIGKFALTAAAVGTASSVNAIENSSLSPYSIFNVLDYRSTYGQPGDDSLAIEKAVEDAEAAVATIGGGGMIYFPPGDYILKKTINITSDRVILRGEGPEVSVIFSAHDGDNFYFNKPGNNENISNNGIYDLKIRGHGEEGNLRNGGADIRGIRVNNFHLHNVKMEEGWCGFFFDNFNDINITDVSVDNYKGLYRGWLQGGGNEGRSDVAYLNNCTLGGGEKDKLSDRHGLIIDGFVHTISAKNLYVIGLGGYGLWVRNNLSQEECPAFISLYNLQSEFCTYSSMLIEECKKLTITDAMVHGSKESSNIILGHKVESASLVGGISSGATQAGIITNAKDLTVNGMHFQRNSFPSPGSYPGILVGSESKGTTISGCRSGLSDGIDTQSYGCQFDTGSADFIVTGNNFTGNIYNGIIDGTSTTTDKLIMNNLPIS